MEFNYTKPSLSLTDKIGIHNWLWIWHIIYWAYYNINLYCQCIIKRYILILMVFLGGFDMLFCENIRMFLMVFGIWPCMDYITIDGTHKCKSKSMQINLKYWWNIAKLVNS